MKEGEILRLENKDWLCISSIKISEPQDGFCTTTVYVDQYFDTLPRLPDLVIDGERIGGFTSHELDSEANFLWASFRYRLPAASASDLKEQLEGAKLEISNILCPLNVDIAVFSSNVRKLEVIPAE